MLYDTAARPPRPGTLLESVLIIVSQRRRKAEYYNLRATVLASLLSGQAATKELSTQLDETIKEFIEMVLPSESNKGPSLDDEAKEVLSKWVNSGTRSVRPLDGHVDTNTKNLTSRLKRATERAAAWKRN